MMDRLRRTVRLAAAVTLVATGAAFVTARPSRAADDPYPSNLAIEGDSWPQFTIQKLENDAFNAGDLGSLAPKFTAITPGESAARVDLASGTTDLAAVSEPLTTSDLATATPNGITPGYVAYGLSGVSIIVGITTAAGFAPITSLNLTLGTLAKVMTHQIQNWSSPEILAENPNEAQSLLHPLTPQVPIQVVERRTSSPTTAALISAFLADPTARGIWDTYATELGSPADTVLDVWPDDTLSSASGVTAGEEGVISDVLDLQASGPPGPQNAIGYVTPQWAQANHAVQVGLAPSGSTSFVLPTAASIGAAFASSGTTFDATSDLYTIEYTKLSDAGAYPIPLPGYLAVPLKGGRSAKAAATLGFLNFVLSSTGQADDTATGTIPLPAAAMTAAQAAVAKFKADNLSTPTSTSTTPTTGVSTTAATTRLVGSGTSDSGASQSSGSSDLPATGATLPVGAAVLGATMLVVGATGRRYVIGRASRRAPRAFRRATRASRRAPR